MLKITLPMDPHTQPPPTIITPNDPNRPQQAQYVAPVPAEPIITVPLDTVAPVPPQPKPSRRKLVIILLLIAALAGAAAYFVFIRNNQQQGGTEINNGTPAETENEPAATPPAAETTIDPATAEPMTAMMKAYIGAWKTDNVKALSYLDMAALKADPSCEGKCTDADIVDPERINYTESSAKVESVAASAANKVKVYLGTTDAAASDSFKGGYEYTLKASGSSYKIVAIELFFE